MPLGVRYAVTLAGVLAAYSMSHAVTAFIRRGAIDLNFVPVALAFVGVVRGHPLARQLALFAAWLVAVFCTMRLVGVPEDPGAPEGFTYWAPEPRPVALLSLMVAAAVIAGLGTSRAKRFFDLYCVECESHRVRAADLGYRVVRCRRCGNTWNAGEQQPDLTVFD